METMTVIEKDVEVLYDEDIQKLDFVMVKLKLQDEEEGEGWSSEYCDSAESEYKRF